MKVSFMLLGLSALFLAGCGVDPRWGPRSETNQSVPGSRGVDSRWGDPRTGLRKPLEWQYQSLPGDANSGIK